MLWAAIPWRVFPDVATKTEPDFPRTTLNGHHGPPIQRVLLSEELVLRVMDLGKASFLRCFRKAIDRDPTVLDFKVRLHVELDVVGNVTTASSDATDRQLADCLVRSAYRLPFPAPGKPAMVDLPLFYRGEL